MSTNFLNKVSGRKEVANEDIDYYDVIVILQELDMKNIVGGIDIKWRDSNKHGNFGMSPQIALQNLDGILSSDSEALSYKGKHRVYIDKKGRETHYIDLRYGEIGRIFGGKRIFSSPHKKAEINYIVKR